MKELRSRARSILSRLGQAYPEAKVALLHKNPLELLVATILSAQCTDERVNKVTVELFKHYRTATDYAHATPEILEQQIRSTGFFRAKTRNIIRCCEALVQRHGGRVPDTMDELIQLPGVGRKTANVVLEAAFGKSEGVVVDTHVHRLSKRLGLTSHDDPEKIETDLMHLLPPSLWIDAGTLLIWHGRRICNARRPKCTDCPVNDLCPSAEM